ncbi:MAG: LCP family protein, partial [Oscillospiraceae bacterium]|nr:LCP family protein [Oscillospiraceae bacterium]
EDILGIKIPYYVIVEMDAFIKLVDEIGGVWFYVPMDMKYDDYTQDLHIDLKQGYQLLDGDQAERTSKI